MSGKFAFWRLHETYFCYLCSVVLSVRGSIIVIFTDVLIIHDSETAVKLLHPPFPFNQER